MQKDDGSFEILNYKNEEHVAMAEKNPGLVFRVGERLKIKDGDFRVKAIGKKAMVLEGLPGTRIQRGEE